MSESVSMGQILPKEQGREEMSASAGQAGGMAVWAAAAG